MAIDACRRPLLSIARGLCRERHERNRRIDAVHRLADRRHHRFWSTLFAPRSCARRRPLAMRPIHGQRLFAVDVHGACVATTPTTSYFSAAAISRRRVVQSVGVADTAAEPVLALTIATSGALHVRAP
jgi:hypothetical protein